MRPPFMREAELMSGSGKLARGQQALAPAPVGGRQPGCLAHRGGEPAVRRSPIAVRGGDSCAQLHTRITVERTLFDCKSGSGHIAEHEFSLRQARLLNGLQSQLDWRGEGGIGHLRFLRRFCSDECLRRS